MGKFASLDICNQSMHFATMSPAVEYFERFTELARTDDDVLPILRVQFECDSVDSYDGVPTGELMVELCGYLVS